jgi:AAA family ATP:ADP antiporter
MAHSFFMGIAIVTFFAASSALFLTEFGSETLPYVYIASAIISTLTGMVYTWFEKWVSIRKLLIGTLFFLLLSVSAFRLGLQYTDAHWPAFGMMAWFTVLNALLSVEFWGLAGRLLDVRQAKRLFGLAGSGEMISSVIGGLLTPLFLRHYQTADLLIVSAIGLVLCMAVLVKITKQFGDRLTQTTSDTGESRSRFRDLVKSSYIIRIFLLYTLVIIVYYLIDFRFLDSARERYQNQDELARFFGLFFGIVQGITLLILTLATGLILSKFGVRIGMRIRPVLLTICTLLLIVTTLGFGPVGMLFWMALITKMVDLVFSRATSAPAFLVLYQPIDTRRRIPTQVAVESMVGPIAGGLAGGLLILLQIFGPAGVAYVPFAIFILLFAWMTVSAGVYREYRRTLSEALRGRSLEGGSLSLEEGSLVDILKAKLDGPHPGEIIYALDLLERHESEPIEPLLIDLLDHPSPEVREEVLSRVQRLELAMAFPAVKELVETENVPKVRAAALRTFCGLGEAEVIEDVAPFLDHPNPEIKLGAMEGLLHSGGIDGVLLAGQYLIDFENAKDPEERIFAARVLGEVRISSFYRPLIQLLQDENADVRQAALLAAGEMKSARLWPMVMQNLSTHLYHTPAATALVIGGDAAIPALESAFVQPGTTRELQIRIAGVCGRIRGDAAVSRLKGWIDRPDKGIRSEVFQALRQCDFRALDADLIDIRRLIREEASDATWMLAASLDIGMSEDLALLHTAISQEMEQVHKRCFHLLSFIYDPTFVRRAQENLLNAIGQQRAYALEVLDTTLSRDLKAILFPLLENLEPHACLNMMQEHFPQKRMDLVGRLHEIIACKDRRVLPWIRTCALHAAVSRSAVECVETIQANLYDPNPLVRETVAWALSRLDPETYRQNVETLQNDLSPQVVRTVSKIETWREGDRQMLLTIEKVMTLKSVSIFSKVPDEVLANLASVMEEVEFQKGDEIYSNGGSGQTMYIIVDGRIRVHDGDHTFVTLGERDFFGELTTLDPEPHLASVTADEDTRLLGLNGDLLYELMSDHAEVLRGIIHVLCQRLRGKSRNG